MYAALSDTFWLAEQAERSFVNKERMRRLHAHEFVLELLCACMTPFGDPNGTFIGAQISLQALQGASAQPMSSAEQAGPQGTQGAGAGVASATHFREMDAEDMRWLVAECLPACFVFLEHFCRGLPRNQIQVARHVSLITAFLRAGVRCVELIAYSNTAHTCVRLLPMFVSSYYLYMCPHTTRHVSLITVAHNRLPARGRQVCGAVPRRR